MPTSARKDRRKAEVALATSLLGMWPTIAAVRVVTELGLLAAAAVGGWGLANGWLAVALTVAVATLWGLLVAPKAKRRLSDPARVILEVALFVIGGALLAAAGLPMWGIALLVIGAAVALLVRHSPFPM